MTPFQAHDIGLQLELSLRAVEIGDIEERIEKLEAIAKGDWKGLDNEQPNRAQAGGSRNVNGRP